MLVNIQFLRFAAAMLVVLYHVAMQWNAVAIDAHGWLKFGAAAGFAGVDVFFVISGFIMAYTTGDLSGHRHGWYFARKRVARIYSGHWPFFLLSLLVFTWTRPEHVANSSLVQSFLLWPQALNLILLQVTWTLSFELYFYLLFALLLWLVPMNRRMALCGLLTVLLVSASIFRHFVAGSFDLERLFLMPFWVHFLFSPFVAEFFAGAVTAYWLQKNPEGTSWPFLAIGIALFLSAGIINDQLFDGKIEQGFYVVPRVLLFGSASVLIVAGLVRLEQRGISAPRRFSMLSGGASYSIYLCHVLIISVAVKTGVFAWAAGASVYSATVAWAGLVFLVWVYAVLHYRHVERPLHRLFRNWTGVGGGTSN